jgi:hypothetical protein
MPASGDLRTVQVARLLGLAHRDVSEEAARAAIAAQVQELGAALFREAVDNDDVISSEAALDYLEVRLSFFGDLIAPNARLAVRAAFAELLAKWE